MGIEWSTKSPFEVMIMRSYDSSGCALGWYMVCLTWFTSTTNTGSQPSAHDEQQLPIWCAATTNCAKMICLTGSLEKSHFEINQKVSVCNGYIIQVRLFLHTVFLVCFYAKYANEKESQFWHFNWIWNQKLRRHRRHNWCHWCT